MSVTTVSTADGDIRGVRSGPVVYWRSIPYAAPPVGDLRFRAPRPVTPWTGVRDATTFGYASIQNRSGAVLGYRKYQPTSEDCLTLNVTAPARPASSPRPVLVFIHGGGYLMGTSAMGLYSGKHLVPRGDVVLVSMNYRLGVLGYVDFSSFGTTDRPFESNLGLRDQIAALEWVQRNIAAFGGDPNNVTIFGESAGAHAVTALLATPAAHGLFHRAIAESAPGDWEMNREDAAHWARECIDALGATPADAVSALTEADPHELRRAAFRAFRDCVLSSPGFFPMVPVIDGELLPKSPLDAIADGTASRVPLIIGTNRDEGALFARYLDVMPTTVERLRRVFAVTDPEAHQRIAATYERHAEPRASVRLGGDLMFWRPTIAVCESHSQHAPTYNYRFDFTTTVLRRMRLGATHAAEMLPVFGIKNEPMEFGITAAGGRRGFRQVSNAMQSHWLNFARYGRPLPSWPKYELPQRKTFIFDNPTRVVSDLERDRREAWQSYKGNYADLWSRPGGGGE
ncbi:carboxylesterase/lipase family protein [Skermania sp. ID1734]|uniref:carboxylesterase/lipase family protein n=1 Tax=Skermania sp. ID1734 TaxID=2597516 RepID=UPI00117C4276|nr:carboxylesterase/lipase family protein [Skermania sp. ID1734]TSD99674.1 carboxylesterase/lipase family protein [Skermania sp. ID1734]